MDADTGQTTVAECEPKAEMMAGEEGGEPKGQTFGSVDEALQAAKAMLAAGGAQGPEDAKASIMAGYNKAGNRPMVGM